MAVAREDHIDVLTTTGEKTGLSKPRGNNRDGVHVCILVESTQELLLQRRSDNRASSPGLWDISSSAHISAGDSSLVCARRKLHKEIGVKLPNDAFEEIFVFLRERLTHGGKYINNEFFDVYLVTILHPIPLEAFTLQEDKVSAVKYIPYEKYRSLLAAGHPVYVPYDVNGDYGRLFDIIRRRYQVNTEARSLSLQKQIQRYDSFTLDAQLAELSEADQKALGLIVEAAKIIDEIFYEQVWNSNTALRDWLKEHANASELDKVKWEYFLINKSPWSLLDENEAFLTTADSAVKLAPDATKPIAGWNGLEYKASFPVIKPPGANFYPPDMDKTEFTSWLNGLDEEQKRDATGFFSVIRRHSEAHLDASLSNHLAGSTNKLPNSNSDLYSIPYSQIYRPSLTKAAELLHKAGEMASSPSLKKLLHSKADAFLSNDYYESDIAWLDLDSKLDVIFGPYETYQDKLFGYKATFEAIIGIRDDKATADIKLFMDNLRLLEENLPLDEAYKPKDVTAGPRIRVIQLIHIAGDVKGPQPLAYTLPNDERFVKERRTSMVILKNVCKAWLEHLLKPVAEFCISKDQREFVDFDSCFPYLLCLEFYSGIGPHTIMLHDGRTSTVREELQELYPVMEAVKANMVGLWAAKFLITKGLLSKCMVETMYVFFLAIFFLGEAPGKGSALQFNWLYEKGAFVVHEDVTFSVDFAKIEGAVESLSREILTIQARGDKTAASLLLEKYCTITEQQKTAMEKLKSVEVPVNKAPTVLMAYSLMD